MKYPCALAVLAIDDDQTSIDGFHAKMLDAITSNSQRISLKKATAMSDVATFDFVNVHKKRIAKYSCVSTLF